MLTMARGFFRACSPRSGLPGVVVVAVLVGWLCLVVSVGVCSVTCGHVLWPVIGVLTAGRAVVPTADSACYRRV